MRRHWIALAALALLPVASMAASPAVKPSSTEAASTDAVSTDAPTDAVEAAAEIPTGADPSRNLEMLEEALFLLEAEEASNHCCPAGAAAACAEACAPNPSFTACGGSTCFCVCITIN